MIARMRTVFMTLLLASIAVVTVPSCVIGGDEPWDGEDTTDIDTDGDGDGDTDTSTGLYDGDGGLDAGLDAG
jgi:hypothetical protein